METKQTDAPGSVEEESAPAKGRPVSRRGFVAGGLGAAAMIVLGGVTLFPETALCRPPGAQDEVRFMGACIRCQKCAEVCPAGVIVPSHIEDGIASMRTPRLDFSRSDIQLGGKAGWCDHCQSANGGVARCVQVCPSGALDAAQDQQFADMSLGLAVIDHSTCLAWNLKGCTVCKNACPTGAIVFDEHNRPVVQADACNGCGACEQSCVSLESTSVGEGTTARSTNERAVVVRAIGE